MLLKVCLALIWLSLPFAHAQEVDMLDVGRLLLLSFEGTEPPLERLAALRPAGFIFFPGNLTDAAKVRRTTGQLQAAAGYPLLFGVDQEGGAVSSLRTGAATLFPGNLALGAAGDPALARRVGEAVGRELTYAGLNLNFAPVVDVASNPDNPIIGMRSFGSSPAAVAALGAAFARGLERVGVAAVAKHFPGHGGTDADSHIELPVVARSKKELARLELPPFKALIAAGVPAMMSAHVVFPALDHAPATLSKPVLTGLLRRELGFEGVLITDAMNMRAITGRYGPGEAAVRSVQAGADLLLLVGDAVTQREVYRALKEALASGRLSEARVREATVRTARLARRYAQWYARRDAPRPDHAAHRVLAERVARQGSTLVWNDGVLPLGASQEVLVVAPQPDGYGEAQHLGSVLKGVRKGVRSVLISQHPTEAERAEAVRKAKAADVVVLASYHWQGPFPAELVRLEADLAALATPLVVVALGNPDDLRFFSARPDAYAAVYGYRDANLLAARALLLGERLPTGRLPVPVGPFPVGAGMRHYD
jgi:beta-N-acetylhexosaminidase